MAFDTSDALTQSGCGDELVPGTRLFHGAYRITRFINSGGFGITYVARDSLDREVVVKECFSSTFCRRTETRVRARSQSTQGQMHKIVKSFLNEAQSLAKLSHPNIVGVHQVFEDNDTAYMVLDYIRGHDLLEIIDEKKVDLRPDQIVSIATKLVSAIGYIHDNDILHCDISPDNIFVNREGEPILIDFGAARRSAAGEEQKYSGLSVVKDGYSPHELYATGGKYGAWSDIYALAASLYHAITGKAPENCQSRLAALAEKRQDPCQPLAGRVAGYPAGFLETIDRAMAVMPGARFQTAKDWIKALPKQDEAGDKRVLLLRRAVPTVAAARPASSTASASVRPNRPVPRRPITRVANLDISDLRQISGFLRGWLVDSETGYVMADESGPGRADMDATMSANLGVARANFSAISRSGPNGVDDIVISLGRQTHLIRPLERAPKVFICVALDRETADPVMARMQVKEVERSVRL
jgi:serine/threonine protein kinase